MQEPVRLRRRRTPRATLFFNRPEYQVLTKDGVRFPNFDVTQGRQDVES